jgi:predicted RNA-binding Zn ribbon-like protein
MSKQQRAPGDLERVREFVNSIDLERHEDELDTPAALKRWMAVRGLMPSNVRVSQRDLRQAIELREALRRLLLAHNGAATPGDASVVLDQVARRSRVRLRFADDSEPFLEPEARGVDGALGRIVAIVQESAASGTWPRLKACREHSCEWAFYDHTKNRSGAWCTMQVCGNRAKARAYRARQAAP